MNFFKKVILLSYVSVASTKSAMLTPAFPSIQNIFHFGMGFCTLIFLAMFGFKLYFPIIFFLNALLLYYFGGFVFLADLFSRWKVRPIVATRAA